MISIDVERLGTLVQRYLSSLQYNPPDHRPSTLLKEATLAKIQCLGLPVQDDQTWRMCFETGISVAAEMYPLHSLEVRTLIAVFTFLGFIIDDCNREFGDALDHFQQRLISKEQQPSDILSSFATILRETYLYYDPIVANFIVQSALAFVSANALEVRPEYQSMMPPKSATNWPYYFREKEGLPEVYTYFCFPKEFSAITKFLPAVPDMGKFINLTNDILSFYKEEKAGEARNYIHKIMFCRGGSAEDVLTAVIEEATASYLQSQKILADDPLYGEVWTAYAMGYVAMHIRNRRYLLSEIIDSSDIMR